MSKYFFPFLMQLSSSTLTAGDTIFKRRDNCLIPTGRIGTLHDANVLSCASNCLKDQACVAFEYFDTNPTCLMSSAYIESDSCTSVGSMYQSSKKDTIALGAKNNRFHVEITTTSFIYYFCLAVYQ